METYNLTEQQIKDLASGRLKVTDILKKEITPGWYKVYFEGTDNDLLGIFYIYKVSGSEVWYKYGYNYNINQWEDCEDWAYIDHTYISATDEEVMKMLTEEAKRRGFVKGAKCKGLGGDIKAVERYDFWNVNRGLIDEGKFNLSCSEEEGVVFRRGEWAVVVVEETVTIEERLERIEKVLYLKL
jgi:hypothetical protein